MEKVIEDIKANKEKANAIIAQANERHDKMIAAIPDEAKGRIQGLKDSNQESLNELAATLNAENKQKEKKLAEDTKKIVNNLHKVQEEHLSEIADILYNKVINVA